MIAPFSIARLPRIEFGAGRLARVPALAGGFGHRALLVTGWRSFMDSPHGETLRAGLKQAGVVWEHLRVSGEPSPDGVDTAVRRWHGTGVEVVIGVGGGSVLDAAKAIAGLLPHGHSVMEHLEGVGPERPYRGPSVPCIAVPTTAGTGSEATKNAVLSVPGPDGFKKSFRHEQLVPQYAVVDPDLLAGCPPALIAANGMDALTQLMESYVSLGANPCTDALARSGLAALRDALLPWHEDPAGASAARAAMAYAALLSGVTLAQTGLGSVHGLAAPLGAFFPIPHGVVCGTLVAAATQANIHALSAREPAHPALEKYAQLGELLTGVRHPGPEAARAALVEHLREWTVHLGLAPLRDYGVSARDLPRIVAHCRGSSMKTNPIVLTDAEISDLLRARL